MFQEIQSRSRTGPVGMKLAAVLCLVLLALLAVAQVAHLHPRAADADHCPLCILMHSVAPAAMAAAIIVLVQVECARAACEPLLVVHRSYSRLFIRPPPAGF